MGHDARIRMRAFADDTPIEERIAEKCRQTETTVAVAESCTGGLVGSLLTDVPGASDYFDRAIVTYSYASKLTELAVDRGTLDEHGAVSAPVARQMATAARDLAGVDWGVSTTGVAGPTGGTAETPVGSVYIGVARRGDWGTGDSTATVDQYEFDGTRLELKERFARQALKDLAGALDA